MAYHTIELSVADRIATVTINRPDKLNALNVAVFDDLSLMIDELRDRADVGGVIITGAGRAFIAGADISELEPHGALAAKALARRGQLVFNRLESLPKPVIAAVNGFALGGGCELAMACHVRIASEAAKFGQPEVKLGLIPGYGGTQRLPRLVGKGVALEMLLTGRHITAAEALQMGLVNRVVPAANLLAEAKALAAELALKAPIAVQYIIEAVHRGLEVSFDKGQFLEAALFGLVASTDDMREGTKAFLEKRKPDFRGQ